MDTRNRRQGPWDSLKNITDAITALEDTYVKAIWFESIGSGTSGTFSPPAESTINLNEWAAGVDALVSGIDSGVPTFAPLFDTEGVQISATLDANGNWTLSGVPVDGYPVAIIFSYSVQFSDFDYSKTLDPAYVEGPIATGFLGELSDDISGFSETGRSEVTFSVADTTGVVTVQPSGSRFSVWVLGREHIFTGATTTTLDKTEGIHIVYFDSSGTLQSSSSPFENLIEGTAFVCLVYWDAAANVALLLGDERHGISMAGETHRYLHQTRGAQYVSGLSIANIIGTGDGSSNTHAYFSMSDGYIYDEDVEINTSLSSQVLTLPAQIPVWYMDGATGTWRKETADDFPVKTFAGGDNLLAYNLDTAGTWSQAEVSNGDFVLCHIFCTNDVNDPVIAIQGQADYANLPQAQAGAETEILNLRTDGLPSAEYVPLYTIIYQTNTSYTNDVQARIRQNGDGGDYLDWRGNVLVGTAGTPTDHGSLSGLQGGTGGEYYHLTSAQESGLTGGADTNLHEHDTLDNSGATVVSTTTAGANIIDSANSGSTDLIMQNSSLTARSKLVAQAAATKLQLFVSGSYEDAIVANHDGAVELYYNDLKAVETEDSGINVYDTSGATPTINLYSDTPTLLSSIYSNGIQLNIKNEGTSGWVSIIGTDSGAADSTMIVADPDEGVELYYNGLKVFDTWATGIEVRDSSGTDAIITMRSSTPATQATITSGASDMTIKNFADHSTGAKHWYFKNDQDETILDIDTGIGMRVWYNGTTKNFSTSEHGFTAWSSGDTPSIAGQNSSGNLMFRLQHQGVADNDDLWLYNYKLSGKIIMYGEDSGSAQTVLFYADPDAEAYLTYNGGKALATRSGGINVFDNSGNNPEIRLYEDDETSLRGKWVANGVADIYFQNLEPGGDLWLSAEVGGTTYWAGLDPNGPNFQPSPDSAINLGKSTVCWLNVYADAGVTSCSDEKYKKDIQVTQLGLEFINDLVPVAFKFNKEGKRPKNHDRVYQGLLANEVEAVLQSHGHTYHDFAGIEESFDEDDGTRWLGLKYEQFIAPLIKSVQELTTRLEDSEALASTLYTQSQYLTEQNNLKNTQISELTSQMSDLIERVETLEKK